MDSFHVIFLASSHNGWEKFALTDFDRQKSAPGFAGCPVPGFSLERLFTSREDARWVNCPYPRGTPLR